MTSTPSTPVETPAQAAVEPARPAAIGIEPEALVTASNTFAFELWAKASARPGNLALSPASITAALAMTWGGARAATADEMRAVLHLEGDADAVMTGWGALAGALQRPTRKLTLRIANRLFGEHSYRFEPRYLERTRAAHGAALEPVDFRTGADAARLRINRWVEDQTAHRIKDLLPAGSITAATRLALVNAIYFLADWDQPFAHEATSPRPFWVTASTRKPVPMMHHRATFRIAKADGVTLVELPYQGRDAAMWVVVPDAVDGLAAVELDARTVLTWKAALQPREVALALPRFTIDPEAPLELSRPLIALGMVQAFSDTRADFTGISAAAAPDQRLFLSGVFHKAFVKVDEQGTEAAAATAVVMGPTGAPPRAEPVTVDRPFLFLIVDTASDLILFVGRVADPSAA